MTALLWFFDRQKIYIASDTLTVSAEERAPRSYQTKVFPLPHLQGVVCGAGSSAIIMQWLATVNSRILARDLMFVDTLAPALLAEIAEQHGEGNGLRTAIYHFGYDGQQPGFRGYSYKSWRGWESQELECGLGLVPGNRELQYACVQEVEELGVVESFVKLLKGLRAHEDGKPIHAENKEEERINIGGELHFLTVEDRNHYAMWTCHRFDDFLEMYEEMLMQLQVEQAKEREASAASVESQPLPKVQTGSEGGSQPQPARAHVQQPEQIVPAAGTSGARGGVSVSFDLQVDARGSSNPAEVEAAARRGVEALRGRLVREVIAAIDDASRTDQLVT